MLRRKGLHVALGIVAALAILFGAVSATYAQGPVAAEGGSRCGGPRGAVAGLGYGWGWGMHGDSLVDATAEATGLTADEVIAALDQGQTLAQIAEAQGVDPQAIADTFLASRSAALEEAVADGSLTQEQADAMLQEMAEHVTEHLDQTWTPRSFGDGRMDRGAPGRGMRSSSGRGSRPYRGA